MTWLLLVLSPAAWSQSVTVVEYYNRTLNAYFITGRASEQALLDTIPDFQRTGMSFQARAASAALPGQQAVCRYAIQVTPSFVSHFYGLTADCDLIASLIAQGRITNFTSEGLDFAVEPTRSDGTCNAGSFPVYRSLRLGSPVNVPNHRYSVLFDDYLDSIGAGYEQERAVFCVPGATPVTPRPDYRAWASLKDRCAVPRTGISPITGRPYPDQPGTHDDEKKWLRFYADASYLWWRESPHPSLEMFPTASELFPQLLTPAKIVSGLPKDRYSRPQRTEDFERSLLGTAYGYGITYARIRDQVPREWIVLMVQPRSPAALAGVRRGDRLIQVDGVDFVNNATSAGVATINRGIFPRTVGETHSFVFAPSSGGGNKSVVLQSAELATETVPVSNIIQTANGRVGYIHFTSFGPFSAEKSLADAIAGFLASGGIDDLVLDLRYNSGGSIATTARLGYMIAGPARTQGKRFATLQTNDKKFFGPDPQYSFISTGSGNPGGVAAGSALPTLNLGRVFILTSSSSASASEAIINGLRGIGVDVITLGQTTFGKPVGQYVVDNCGLSLNLINFITVNDQGQADYFDGIAPACNAQDDLNRELGDPAEAKLSAALFYRANGRCPASSTMEIGKQQTHAFADSLGLSLSQPEPGGMFVLGTEPRRDRGLPITPRKPFEVDDSSVRR